MTEQARENEGTSNTGFEFDISLVSGLFDFDLDNSYGSDAFEAFDYYFYNHGGTDLEYEACPAHKPGVDCLAKDTAFNGLFWDFENELFEGATPHYEIETSSGDEDSGWNYTYRLLVNFSARTFAKSLEEAMDKVRKEAMDKLAIYDGGIDEIIDIEEVRLVSKGMVRNE